MGAIIRTEQLYKSFGRDNQEIVVLAGVNLEVEEGSFTVIVGPSGCGKSTLLNIVAGLAAPTSGCVYYRETPLLSPRLEIGYLTQKDTLMPWRNIESNIAMPLEIRGLGKVERRERTNELIQLVGLKGFEKHYPHELSGGMLRRAGLARMLSATPETLLMDEPFGALDAQLRLELQGELLNLWTGSGKSVLFITHDIEEALLLGDRVVVFGSEGSIVYDEAIFFPRPRDAATLRFQTEFATAHQRIWNALVSARMQQEAKR
ncbi:ABC transporter ATP-binding protein [Ktedonosporobacter rubrisoli]|uniref:ABC transporter ATP-binding protein n=1 Tax=Ktedonosporobacter rubrisoli TaxID=2509675 RepID=A0A4P6K5X6_KTERU|nr:ABC transporter ATP-binding protein [Ktedonosporobacter rubrisoli]QBD82956.1 ABC transporter ATP-binding protein [Ktedonosporobacter rubrisoli]